MKLPSLVTLFKHGLFVYVVRSVPRASAFALAAILLHAVVVTSGASETPSLVVTVTTDVVDNADNQTSLREALAYAAQLGGTQTVTFSNATAGGATNFYDGTAHTIALAGGTLTVSSNVKIAGPRGKGAHHRRPRRG